MSVGGSDHPPDGRIPEELIDALLDGELDRAAQRRLFESLRRDPSACADLARTRRIVSLLRRQPEAPDLTGPILAEVRRRRGFLPASVRRLVTAGRLAAAATLLLGALGVAVAHRHWPEALQLGAVERPVSLVASAGQAEASAGVRQIASAVIELQERVVEPVPVGAAEAPSRVSARHTWLVTRLEPGPLSAVRRPTLRDGDLSATVIYTGSGSLSVGPITLASDGASTVVVPLGQQCPAAAARARLSGTWPVQVPGTMVLPPVQHGSPVFAGVIRREPAPTASPASGAR